MQLCQTPLVQRYLQKKFTWHTINLTQPIKSYYSAKTHYQQFPAASSPMCSHSHPLYQSVKTRIHPCSRGHTAFSILVINYIILKTDIACSHQVVKTQSGSQDAGHCLRFPLHIGQETLAAVRENAKYILHNSLGAEQMVVKDPLPKVHVVM